MANHLITSVNVTCGNLACGKSFPSTLTHTTEVCPYCLYASKPLIFRELRENSVGSDIILAHGPTTGNEEAERTGRLRCNGAWYDKEANEARMCTFREGHVGPHSWARPTIERIEDVIAQGIQRHDDERATDEFDNKHTDDLRGDADR